MSECAFAWKISSGTHCSAWKEEKVEAKKREKKTEKVEIKWFYAENEEKKTKGWGEKKCFFSSYSVFTFSLDENMTISDNVYLLTSEWRKCNFHDIGREEGAYYDITSLQHHFAFTNHMINNNIDIFLFHSFLRLTLLFM